MVEVGSIVGGKFRIDRVLGRGGMGVVCVATHLQLEQQVALKVVHDALTGDAEVVERFVREARASARLRSEHACKVTDVGVLDTGAPYIVMELLDGSDLQAVIADGALPVATAADYVLQACVAVAEAHALGIVHRDLKPANLFLTHRLDGTPLIKVLDFGIAKATTANDFKITRTQAVMGSPGYMSPEQLRSARDAEPRSDIWALGVILFEMVTGHLPFHGDSITELAVKVVMDPPAPLDVGSPAFTRIVYRCLEKAPEQRYPTIAALAADLAPLAGERGGRSASMIAALGTAPQGRRAPTVPVASGKATTLQTAAAQSTGGPLPPVPRKRSRIGLVVGGIALVTVAAAITVFAIRRASGPSEPSRPPIAALPADATVATSPEVPTAPPRIEPALPPPGPAGSGVPSPRDRTSPGDAAAESTPDAGDGVPEIRAKIRALAASHDWSAVLQLADLDRDDAELAPVVSDAKRQYVAQQARAIDAQVKQGQCARARALAATAHQVVPDDATLEARARACKPRATPVPPPPRAPPTLADATQAFQRGDFARALELAEQLLAADPKNAAALRIAALSACSARNVDKATLYAARLPARERAEARDVCDRNSIELDGDAPRDPDDRPDDRPDDKPPDADLGEAMRAASAGQWEPALSHAEAALQRAPRNLRALSIGVTAACHLRRDSVARSLLRRLPPPRQRAMRQLCARAGVLL